MRSSVSDQAFWSIEAVLHSRRSSGFSAAPPLRLARTPACVREGFPAARTARQQRNPPWASVKALRGFPDRVLPYRRASPAPLHLGEVVAVDTAAEPTESASASEGATRHDEARNVSDRQIYVPVKRRGDARSDSLGRDCREHPAERQQTPILLRRDGKRFAGRGPASAGGVPEARGRHDLSATSCKRADIDDSGERAHAVLDRIPDLTPEPQGPCRHALPRTFP